MIRKISRGSILPSFVQGKFLEYYQKNPGCVQPPTSLEKREFGFLLFEGRVMLRHKGFKTADALSSYLKTTAASDVYYSSAYYEQPQAEMEKKGFLGADLVFDIDADHIPTPCGKVHDSWTCNSCGFAGKGPSPEKCPACGESKFDSKTWTCDTCLESAKEETVKLLDMLTEDFGFADDELEVYFSGNRGYHVHVDSEKTRLLDSLARKEIVDYIIGLGLKAELHSLMAKERIVVSPDSAGWRSRIVKGIGTFLEKATPSEIEKIGLGKNATKSLVENKETLLQRLKNKQWLNVKGLDAKNWEKIIQWVVSQQSAKIDTVVTTDIHRLIRLAGSLHGKTGLIKVEASLSGLDSFDPLKEAIAFKEGHVVVDVVEAPEFRMGDVRYGPFKNSSRVELPTAAAMFLMCRGAAQVAE